MLKNIVLSIGICGGLVACGGGSSSDDGDDPQDEPNTQTGVFLDSPVVNIGYRTESGEGVTSLSGEYSYLEGETVTFFIGDLQLPTVRATDIVTPLDIAGSQSTSDTTVINIIRLLQSLDEDGNPDNGISISEIAKSSATQVDFSLPVDDFSASTAVTALVPNSGSSNMALIPANDAITHFEQQLKDNGISFGEIIGVWEIPDDSALFMYLPDDRYFAIQWEEENDFIGFERGTYATGETEITFDTLQNNDGEALVCNPPMGIETCSGEVWGFSISGDELTLAPSDIDPVVIPRTQFPGEGLQGAWELPNESAIFVFLPDDRYFAIQWEEENGFIGFERGTYAMGETEIIFDTLQNNDGEALVCDPPTGIETCSGEAWEFSISGDELTLAPSGEGPVTFERLL